MPPRDYDNRRVEVYFGPSRKVQTTKEELADFIIEEMGLKRSDGGPKWTEGVAELVDLGMEAFEEQYSDDPEYAEEVSKLNRKPDEYQSEVRETATTQQKPADTLIHASKLTRRAQARILKVLSEQMRKDDGRTMFVDLMDVAKEADMDYSAVSHLARLLDISGFVRRDTYGEKAKLRQRNSLDKYCETRLVDQDSL